MEVGECTLHSELNILAACVVSHVRVLLSLYTGIMLMENNSLKELYLDQCVLQPEGLEQVIKGLQVNTKLKVMGLSDSTIDNKSASSLGKSSCISLLFMHISNS